MKKIKISFLAVCILAAFSASAQVSFGVKGGLNISNLSLDKESTDKDEKSSVKMGFNIGLTAEYMLSENMGIQSGLSFTTLGSKTSFSEESEFGKVKMTSTLNFNALQIPIHFAYKIQVAENCNVTLHGGPYLGYILSGSSKFRIKSNIEGVKADVKNDSKNLYAKDSDLNLKRFDSGLGFGVALGYGNCYVDLGYDMGLVNLLKISKEDKKELKALKENKPYMKTMNLYLSVGYRF